MKSNGKSQMNRIRKELLLAKRTPRHSMRLSKLNSQPKSFYYVKLCIAWFCVSLAVNVYSDNSTNAPIVLTDFFKRAISSPPDVSRYIVLSRSLRTNPIIIGQTTFRPRNSFIYYEGARAGTNFFIHVFSTSNSIASTNNLEGTAGRAGASLYQLCNDSIQYGIGTNAF